LQLPRALKDRQVHNRLKKKNGEPKLAVCTPEEEADVVLQQLG
jgi:hypothetical protein